MTIYSQSNRIDKCRTCEVFLLKGDDLSLLIRNSPPTKREFKGSDFPLISIELNRLS